MAIKLNDALASAFNQKDFEMKGAQNFGGQEVGPRKASGWTNTQVAMMMTMRFEGKLVWDDSISGFWLYVDEQGYWVPVSPNRMKDQISYATFRWGNIGNTETSFDDIYRQMRRHTPSISEDEDEWVAFSDCLWSPKTGETAPKSPERFSTLYVPVDYAATREAKHDLLDAYLRDTCVDRDGKPSDRLRQILQEYAGYLLWPTMKQIPALFLYGDGSNGKSVFIDVVTALVGKERKSTSGLNDLFGKEFGLSRLIGMRLNAASETSNCRDSGGEKFKQATFGEIVTTRRKYGDDFDFPNKAKFIFSLNTMLAFGELNRGITRRVLIVPFHRTFDARAGETIDDLGAKIVAEEFPGIVRWAMDGLQRLKDNSWKMTTCTEVDEMMDDFIEESSSVGEYLHEFYEKCDRPTTNPIDAFMDYKDWVKNTANRLPVSRRRFANDFASVFGRPSMTKRDGKTIRLYKCRPRKSGEIKPQMTIPDCPACNFGKCEEHDIPL